MRPGALLIAGALTALLAQRRQRLTLPGRVGLVIVALVVSGSGLVELPGTEQMVRDATSVLGDLTYVVVGGFAFGESGAFVGLVVPGELVVVLGGVTAGHGTIALPTLIAVVWGCALGGDLLSYTLGRRLGRDVLLRHGAALGITEPRLAQVERFLQSHGPKTILLGRFIGLIRALAPFIAGASAMPARRFIPVAVLASGLWAAVFACLGYAFWESLDTLIAIVERGSVMLAALAVIVVLVTQLRRRRAAAH